MSPMTTYWIILAAGILLSAGLFIFFARLGRYSILRAGLGFLLGFPLAWLFAKAFYVIIFSASLPQGRNVWLSLKPEEFSFVAGCVGFCLGPALLFANRRKEIPGVLDQLALPGCILAGTVRFTEIYLAVSDISNIGLADFALKKTDVLYPALLNKFLWSVPLQIGGSKRIQLQPVVSTPTALTILIVAVYIGVLWGLSTRKNTGLGKGMVFERCVFLLCASRIFWEMFHARMKFFFVPVDQALCAVIILALTAGTAVRHKKATGRFPVWPFIPMIHCIVINALAQFFMDGKNYLLSESVIEWGNELLEDFRDIFRTKIMGFSIILATCIALVVIFGLLCLKVTNAGRRSKKADDALPAESPARDKSADIQETDQAEKAARKEATGP